MRSDKKVSLGCELSLLADSLESARLLAELLATGSLPDEETAIRAPQMLEASLTLAIERVKLLRKVVIGAADMALLEHRNNRALPHRKGDDPDVVLSSSPTRRR